MTPDIKPGDRLLYRGAEYRVLTVEPRRMDPICRFDTADIEAGDKCGDVDLFGFEDIEAVRVGDHWVAVPVLAAEAGDAS